MKLIFIRLNSNKMDNIQSYLAKIICLFGCFYHLFEISEIYFSYETSTNVRHDSGTRIELPGITACYNKKHQVENNLATILNQTNATLDEIEKGG